MMNPDTWAEFKSRTLFWGTSRMQSIGGLASNYRYRFDNPYALLAEMHRAQWLPRERIGERSAKKLKAIVDHASRNVPFYKQLYRQAGIDRPLVRGLSDLRKLPIITKDMMRDAGVQVLSSTVPPNLIRVGYTSGSTGDPFRFYLEPNWGPPRWASSWLLDSYFRARPQTKYFRFLPPDQPKPPESNIHAARGIQKLRIALGFQLNNVRWVSGHWLTEKNLAALLESIRQFRPAYGSGAPSFWLLLVELMTRTGLADFPRLAAIVSDAEMLLPHERKQIEHRLGCPVFERYGSREFHGAIAGECGHHSGLHVNEDLFLVEIVDIDGEPCAEGDSGRILITDLRNRLMPFIRYEIGDMAMPGGGCPCGRNFLTIREIVGRKSEFIEASDGRRIPVRVVGAYLMIGEKLTDMVRYFQFIQVRPGRLIFRVIPFVKNTQNFRSRLEASLGRAERLLSVNFEVELASRLETSSSGKRMLLVKRGNQ